MTTTAIQLTDDETTVLAKVLDTLSPAQAGACLSSDDELAVFINARRQISSRALELVHADTASRRRGNAHPQSLRDEPVRSFSTEELAFLRYIDRPDARA
jgi:hypothetical protein